MPVVIAAGMAPISRTVLLWDNKANLANISASSTAVGFPASNAVDSNTWNSWKGLNAPSALVVDLGSSASVDSVGISAHNMLSSGVTQFQVQYSDNGTSYTTATSATPTSDEDYLVLFNGSSHRYWRVNFSGAVANIGYVSLGNRLIFPHSPVDDYVPLNHSRQYTKLRNESLKNQLLGNRVVAAGASTEVDMGYLDRTWVDNNLTAFKSHYDQGGTFFYASCPSKYPLDMGYCWSDGEDDTIEIVYVEADKMSTVNFSLRSYVAQ